MPVVIIGFIITAMLISYVLTGKTLRRAIAAGIIDIPNDRSSHKHPTPRGGGLAIVAVVCVAALVLSGLEMVPLRLGIAISGGGL
ncbi:MAG: glycosyl transferase, partial [Armatimonadota bacterium]|nr:glycosyl transferase [Armatimonadota bacterium]